MRGEEATYDTAEVTAVGSPPHARGRAHGRLGVQALPRITPACAGKRTSTGPR